MGRSDISENELAVVHKARAAALDVLGECPLRLQLHLSAVMTVGFCDQMRAAITDGSPAKIDHDTIADVSDLAHAYAKLR